MLLSVGQATPRRSWAHFIKTINIFNKGCTLSHHIWHETFIGNNYPSFNFRQGRKTAATLAGPHLEQRHWLEVPPFNINYPAMGDSDKKVSRRRVRHTLPAVLMRAGTSKGLFIHRKHLPASESDWAIPLLAAMGSDHSDPRQIDGVGGATSTTSKVAVVGPSVIPGADVDYTFVQVAVGKDSVDMTGSCGNMASGIGPFAIQEGLVHPLPGQRTMEVRIFNTNTSRLIVETVQLNEDGEFEEEGDYVIPGARGSGSEVRVAFVDPAGSMTNELFPTKHRMETLEVQNPDIRSLSFSVQATLVDVANPFILVNEDTLPDQIKKQPAGSDIFVQYIESIRCVGAVKMGLASSLDAATAVRGTPKIAIISRAAALPTVDSADIRVQAFSMGKPHPTLQMTGAVCIAAAVCIPGTVPNVLSSKPAPVSELPPSPERTPSPVSIDSALEKPQFTAREVERLVQIAHPTGLVGVSAVVTSDSAENVTVNRCTVSRTARRIFEGNVMYYSS